MEVRCLARTLHYSWPTCTWHKIIELILLWCCLGRGGLLWNTNSWGASCGVAPISSPLLRKSCTWSVSDDVMFQAYFGEVTMALISILFAARCCQLHELGILCWGTPPNLPTTPRILDRTLCCHDHMHACLRRRAIVFSYLLLLRSTCHDPSFMSHDSPPFCEPTMTHPAIDLLCLALTGSHWQMCPCHRHMLSIGPISWMWMCSTFGSQGMIWWWILRSASSHLQKSPQEMSFIFWHRLSKLCLPPRFMTDTLAQVYC